MMKLVERPSTVRLGTIKVIKLKKQLKSKIFSTND